MQVRNLYVHGVATSEQRKTRERALDSPFLYGCRVKTTDLAVSVFRGDNMVNERRGHETCYFCGETERIERHHIVPRRFEGSDKDENLVSVCPTCHSKLESLYDARFYQELGVEKDSETHGECSRNKCYSEATYEVNGTDGRLILCEKHNECFHRNCGKNPDTVVSRDDIRPYCEDHAVCSYRDCGSKDVILIQATSILNEFRIYCRKHAAEKDYLEA